MNNPGPELVVFGNLLLDDVVYADGTTRMAQPGGAALYVALGAGLWGVKVGIVSRPGSDYPEGVREALTERGVDLEGAHSTGHPTLRTWLLYEGRRRRVVHRLDGPTHDDVSPRPEEMPAKWRPRSVHLAPMPWSVHQGLIGEFSARSGIHLSADPYDLLTEEVMGSWRELFSDIDTLFLSEDEMEIVGGLREPETVLRRFGDSSRLRTIFYKRGPGGGLAFDTRGVETRRWAGQELEVIDPTGAGDAFAGGVLAGRLLGDRPDQALARGVLSAGYAVEGQGPDRLLASTPEEAALALASSKVRLRL